MITHLTGILFFKSPTEITVEVSGIGYTISISIQTFEKLPSVGQKVTILSHLHVREDALVLYGFHSESERQMFLHLVSISGIGPKMAINILSGRNADELKELVIQGNINGLTSLPGIGRKTAERIIVELKDKLTKTSLNIGSLDTLGKSDIRSEALMALIALGYSRQVAEKAIHKSIQSSNMEFTRVEDLIKTSLKQANT